MSERIIVIPEGQETVTVAQLAAMLSVLPSTIYRLKYLGHLPPGVPNMPMLCWTPEAIQAWVKTRVPGKWRHAIKKESARG